MCDVCKSHQKNTYQLNGPKFRKTHHNTLFNIYKNMNANIELCRYHDVELFKFGETKFFTHYYKLNDELSEKTHRFKYKA